MNRARFCVLLALLCLGFAGRLPAGEANPAEALESFAGSWEIVAVTPAGATKEARWLVFNKDGTYAALGTEGRELWGGTFEIDPTATPKIWDHRSYEAVKTGTDVLGIYQLEGDTLKVACVVGTWKDKEWTGKPRPAGFEPAGADVTIELRRSKPPAQPGAGSR
jgi:uncharacterized protein (TIGR03067 family)